MKRRCVPRARGIASFLGVSPASPESSRTTMTSSPGSSCGTMLRSVRWIVGRPLVPTMIEKVAICAREDAIGAVAELGEERVPLPVVRQRRKREAVARLRDHRRLELEADEAAEPPDHRLRVGDEVF